MPIPSHDPESLMKVISEVLSARIGRELTIPFAFASGARLAHLLGPEILTEWEVASFLTNPLHLGKILTAERISERARNIATIAWAHVQFGREEVA
jgi:hypothetical protein